MCVGTCMHVYVDDRRLPQLLWTKTCLALFFKDSISHFTGLQLSIQASLANWWTAGICLSLPPQHHGYKSVWSCWLFLHWFWWMGTGPHGELSPWPYPFYFCFCNGVFLISHSSIYGSPHISPMFQDVCGYGSSTLESLSHREYESWVSKTNTVNTTRLHLVPILPVMV